MEVVEASKRSIDCHKAKVLFVESAFIEGIMILEGGSSNATQTMT